MRYLSIQLLWRSAEVFRRPSGHQLIGKQLLDEIPAYSLRLAFSSVALALRGGIRANWPNVCGVRRNGEWRSPFSIFR